MIEHTINWYNGEIFEAKFILGFGIFILISGALFYYLGNTPTAKALLIPFLVVGLIFAGIGASMAYSNAQKKAQIETVYKQDNHQFVQGEIARVEGFQYLYPLSIGISLVSFLVALALLYFTKNVNLHAVAMALILFGSAFAVIDYFSKERADMYYEQLKNVKK